MTVKEFYEQIGGYYEHGFPLCMVSELTMQMLGYDSAAEFEKTTGNCMAGLVSREDYSEKEFLEPEWMSTFPNRSI